MHVAGVGGDGNALRAGAAGEHAGAGSDGEDASRGLDMAGDAAHAELLRHGAVAAWGVEHNGKRRGGVDAAADTVDGLVTTDRDDGREGALGRGGADLGGGRGFGGGRGLGGLGSRRLGGFGLGGAVHVAHLPARAALARLWPSARAASMPPGSRAPASARSGRPPPPPPAALATSRTMLPA